MLTKAGGGRGSGAGLSQLSQAVQVCATASSAL